MEKRLELYRQIQEKKPRATAPKRIPLTFVKGSRFEELLRPYLAAGLRKGVPSLFQNLRPLYNDPEKAALVEQMLLTFIKDLEENGYASGSLDGSAEMETPTTVLWVYHFLAQHYDRLGNTPKAHLYIDRAIQHTPTLIELLMTKAKIFKHAGNPEEAAHYMEQAQQLDTADRYINSKCAKYMLRAGMITEAEQMCGKFTREGVNPTQNLNEMQCMWFETECAKAYRKLNKIGESLKKCHEVDRHFTGIIEDQFDFHTYCVRKMTLCSYIGLLRLEDILRRHRFYYRAARLAIKVRCAFPVT
uniref:Uncharacterized protein n=1 Tax=Plectus sambesii TaxID=2011161 RepID=A0A914XGM6_9BILA